MSRKPRGRVLRVGKWALVVVNCAGGFSNWSCAPQAVNEKASRVGDGNSNEMRARSSEAVDRERVAWPVEIEAVRLISSMGFQSMTLDRKGGAEIRPFGKRRQSTVTVTSAENGDIWQIVDEIDVVALKRMYGTGPPDSETGLVFELRGGGRKAVVLYGTKGVDDSGDDWQQAERLRKLTKMMYSALARHRGDK